MHPHGVSFSVVYRDDGAERTLDLVCKVRFPYVVADGCRYLRANLTHKGAAFQDKEQYDLWFTVLRAIVSRCATGIDAALNASLPDEVLFWGHHAALPVTSLGAPQRERAAPLTSSEGTDALHSKALVPMRFARAEGIHAAAMSLGPFHGALLGPSGEVYTWGASHAGELGHGVGLHSGTPRRVDALRGARVRQVACGTSYTAAVTEDFELFMWGCVFTRNSKCMRTAAIMPKY